MGTNGTRLDMWGRTLHHFLRTHWHLCLLALCLTGLAFAQYEEETPPDSTVVADSSLADSADAKVDGSDNSDADTATPRRKRYESEETAAAPDTSIEQRAIRTAQLWLRRLLYRGWINPTIIGAYSTYQLTDWSEATGSYGAVEGKLTIHYLGPTEWVGKDAESFQAAFQSMDEENNLIEFDLILPANQKITESYRTLMRVNRAELRVSSLALPASQIDFDVLDRPVEDGARSLKLYAGTFETTVYRGSGDDGSAVVIYRAKNIAPIEVAALGFGEQALTFASTGSNVVPRFKVPPPPGR